MRQSRFQKEVQESKIQEIVKGRDELLEDFKGLGLENKKLKDELKSKSSHSSKRVKLADEKKKEMEKLRKENEF